MVNSHLCQVCKSNLLKLETLNPIGNRVGGGRGSRAPATPSHALALTPSTLHTNPKPTNSYGSPYGGGGPKKGYFFFFFFGWGACL